MFIPWFVYNWVPDNFEIKEKFGNTPGVDPLSKRLIVPEIPIAKHYSENNNPKLDVFEQRLIKENLSQQLSFLQVKDVVPGEGMMVEDILLGATSTVTEEELSLCFIKGSIFFGRVITIGEDSVLLGCSSLDLGRDKLSLIQELRSTILHGYPQITPDVLWEYDSEIRTLFFDLRDDHDLFNPHSKKPDAPPN